MADGENSGGIEAGMKKKGEWQIINTWGQVVARSLTVVSCGSKQNKKLTCYSKNNRMISG